MKNQPLFEPAYVRNIQTNDIYRYLGGDKYLNIRTGVSGFIKPKLAAKIFRISVEAMFVIGENQMVEKFISTLNLKLEHINNP